MAAITRPNYLRAHGAESSATEAAEITYDNSGESPASMGGGFYSADGTVVTGPLGLYEVRALKTDGGADDTTIRVYTGGSILIYEQVHSFADNGDWVAFQLPRDEIVRGGEEPTFTAEAVGAGTHKLKLWAYFTVAAVQ